MANSRELKVVILGDSASAQRAFAQLNTAATTSMGRFEAVGNKFRDVGSKMMATGKNMTLGITAPLALLGKASFDAASDMNESMSKVQTVFGEAAKDIDAFSKTSAKSMGLARQETLDAAGTFGNMFTQLGVGAPLAASLSKEMIKLAADLGSFHNADITQVIEAQTSAFRGEYDALQRFIPTINAATVEQKALEMTGKATTKELTAQEKALAVQALMMKGAGAATGDFARTADGAANSQRIATAQFKDAAAELGNTLIPIGQKFIGVLSGVVSWFNDLSPRMQNVILIFAGLAAVAGPLVTIFGALAVVIGAILSPVGLVVIAVAALAAGLVYAYQKSETFRDIVNAVFGAVSAAAIGMKDVAVGAIRGLVDFWLAQVEWIVKGAAAAFGWVPGIGPKLKAAAREVEGFRDEVNRALGGIKDKVVNVKIGLSSDPIAADIQAIRVPGRAHGGPVSAGRPYIVGEQRPELFVPSQSGTILPSVPGGGGTTYVTHNYAITVEGSVTTDRDLVDKIATGLEERRRRNGPGNY